MFGSSILETAIGLIFVFSLLSILVTQINTFIVNVLNLRAKHLKEGLQNLVNDPDIQAKVLGHPLINMVKATVAPEDSLTKAEAQAVIETEETQLSYIPPETFVEALTSVLTADSDASLYRQLQLANEAMPNSNEKSKIRELIRILQTDFSEKTIRQLRATIENLPDDQTRKTLLSGLEHTENALEKLRFRNGELIPLLEGIRKIENPSFKSAVETIISSARQVDGAQQKLQAWFDDGMDRASDIFRRKLQMISLGVAFALAFVLNVDTLYLARTLWEDQLLRQTVAAAAQNFDESAVTADSTSGTDTATEETGAGSLDENAQAIEESAKDIKETIQDLLELQLPLGWEFTTITDEMVATSSQLGLPDPRQNTRNIWNLGPSNNANWLGLVIQKVIGLVVTMIAAAQGAPFWFDLLRKLTRG